MIGYSFLSYDDADPGRGNWMYLPKEMGWKW